MENKRPTVSLITFTYNRAHLVERAVKSALNQTFQDFELLLIDNGSTDHTWKVLEKYKNHDKVRLFRIEENKGFASGFNLGLDKMRGEWFAILPDDDEIAPEALELLLRVPEEIDPAIDAVTCNSIDTATGNFSAKGVDKDQYLPIGLLIGKTSGNFWGINKTELVRGERLNPNLQGYVNTFWYKLDAIANRYYIHKALRTYYTDHGPTVTSQLRQAGIGKSVRIYKELMREDFYWEVLMKYNKKRFLKKCLAGLFFLRAGREKAGARRYRQMLKKSPYYTFRIRLISGILSSSSPALLNRIHQGGFLDKVKTMATQLLKKPRKLQHSTEG